MGYLAAYMEKKKLWADIQFASMENWDTDKIKDEDSGLLLC